MKNFLNKFSERAMAYDQIKIDELCNLFNSFLLCCKNIKTTAFKNDRNKFVISFFEAVFVTVCKKIRERGKSEGYVSLECINKLKKSKVFSRASQEKTASKSSVDTRLVEAAKIIVLE